MKPKRPTDKDLRLYARLSDVDGDLILDSAIPVPAAKPVSFHRWESVKDFLSRPWAASLAVSAAILTLVVVALLAAGGFGEPPVEPPPHGSYPAGSTPVQKPPVAEAPTAPTLAKASALRKGMSLDELVALMGDAYTEEKGRYTFTLDTGEGLTVYTSLDGADGSATVTGFEWLGDAAQRYNPMDVPLDVLQKTQHFATDTVIPAYAMDSLFLAYDCISLPSAEEVLKGSELCYFRVRDNGETALLDAEGHGAGGAPTDDYSTLLQDVTELFHETVKVRAYYPILTAAERGAVYIVTSIGDYVLYLHGDCKAPASELMDTTPYLVPAADFYLFSYLILSDHSSKEKEAMEWRISEAYMPLISPYAMLSEGYQKPVNPATPEAAEQLMGIQRATYEECVGYLGECHHCAREQRINKLEGGELPYCHVADPSGAHYWELTDGRCLIAYSHYSTSKPPEMSTSPTEYIYIITDMLLLDSIETLQSLGTPSLANYALLRKGMNRWFASVLLGKPLSDSYVDDTRTLLWKWVEDGMVHTVTVALSSEELTDPYATVAYVDSIEYSTMTVSEAVSEIQVGMSYAHITARLGGCLCGHEVNVLGGSSVGYHYWELPDGRCLAAYMDRDIPAVSSPLQIITSEHYSMCAIHLLWMDSAEGIQAVGTPSLYHAQSISYDLEEEIVLALLGEPAASVGTLVSLWQWTEEGKSYTFTVYWKDNTPAGLYQHFQTVIKCELTEGKLSSLPIPDKMPTPAEAAQIGLGMKASELLRALGYPVQNHSLGRAILYVWEMTDGRVFCAVLENDVTETQRGEPVVSYTFIRSSVEDVMIASAENMEEIREGMSEAMVVALLGTTEIHDYMENTHTWIGPIDGAWWELTVKWGTVRYPESRMSRTYASSVTIVK